MKVCVGQEQTTKVRENKKPVQHRAGMVLMSAKPNRSDGFCCYLGVVSCNFNCFLYDQTVILPAAFNTIVLQQIFCFLL